MDLDFSGLTDDQLIELVRLACQEAVRRSDATGAAMRSMMLDEAEKARIMREAGETELRAFRARERERIAREAAERVRQEAEAKLAAERRQQAAEIARQAAEKARASSERAKQWLRRFAEAVERQPSAISVLIANTNYGRRVLVNLGHDRYMRDHLSDYNLSSGKISTVRSLLKRKPQLAALSAEMAALNPSGTIFVSGADHDWSE